MRAGVGIGHRDCDCEEEEAFYKGEIVDWTSFYSFRLPLLPSLPIHLRWIILLTSAIRDVAREEL